MKTPKQIPERLPIALGQVKSSNILENLLSKIRQIVSYLYRAKESLKSIYQYKIDVMFMNSKITDKIDLKRSDKYIRFLTLSTYYALKNIKKLYKNNIFNISAQT